MPNAKIDKMIAKEKIKGIDYLLNKFQERNIDFKELPKCAFLLGAGCSRSSGIPTGYEIIENLRKLWYLNNYANCQDYLKGHFEIIEESFNKLNDDFQEKYLKQESLLKEKVETSLEKLKINAPEYLKKILENEDDEVIKENIFADLLYGFWFESFSENPKERQKFIENLIDSKEPSGAYLLFSHLIANNKITNIFTTNFDDLIYDCLIRYTEIKPKVYSHNEVAQYINSYSLRPNIIKLHGDFLFENIKNTRPETGILWSNMKIKLEECLKSFDLIVVGYNGADDSVMNSLAELKSKHYGLIWCGRNPKEVNWRVKELINNTQNSYFVVIESFELLVFNLYNIFQENISTPDFRTNAQKKEKEFHDFISDFKKELTDDEAINIKEKELINSTLEVILDKNSFFWVSELSTKEQLNFLKTLRIDGISRTLKNIFTNLSWEQSKELYSLLDNSFLIEKMKESSIQHISNALSNLNKIDFNKTKQILDSIDNKILLEKIEIASPEDLYSGISELKSISPEKISEVLSERKVSTESFNIKKLDLRRITFKLKTLSKSQGLDFLISYNNSIYDKIKTEPFKEVVLFFENTSDSYYNEIKAIFDSLNNDFLAKNISEQNLTLLSITLRVFNSLNKDKTKLIVEKLNTNSLSENLNKSDLLSIKSVLFTLKDVNFKLSKQLLNILTDEILIEKINDSELLNISESLEYLSKIDAQRIIKLVKKIDPETITRKINQETYTYQQFGNAMSKLIAFDFDKMCSSARNANTERLSEMISSTLNKTGEQVFLHFVPTYFKVDRELFSKIILQASQEYIDSILKWTKIDLYTVNLPYLKRIFDKNEMIKESKLVEYIINTNQDKFDKKKKRIIKSTRHNKGCS